MEVTIRKGTREDIPAIFEMVNELAAFLNDEDSVVNTLELMQEQNEYFESFIAEHEGVAVGYAVYCFPYSTFSGRYVYLCGLYVKPEFRHKKVGSRLLRKIFETAKAENCKKIRWTVEDFNTTALEMYKNMGAKINPSTLTCNFNEETINAHLEKTKDLA